MQGNQAVSEKTIASWVESYLGKELSLQEIYELCSAIDRGYAEEGYFLARSYPPEQDIHNETLLIEVLEGKLGNVRVEGNKYYTESFIRSYFLDLQGHPLRYDRFFRVLALLNDNTDLSVEAIFEKGKEFGCADVVLVVQDARPVHLYLNGNNYGRNLTTNVRGGGRLDVGNGFFQGDTFSLAEVIGLPVSALYFTDVSYKVPLNRKGTSLKFSYLYSKFRVEELARLRRKGISGIATVEVNQAVMRTRSVDVDCFSYFDYKQIQDFEKGARSSFDKLRVLTVGSSIDVFSFLQGRDFLTLQFVSGIPNLLGGLKAVDWKSSRKGAGGRFFIFNADYNRIQSLPKNCFLYFHGFGQITANKLPVAEQVYIGGSDTIRGFPLAIAQGDKGYYANAEFRMPLPWVGEKRFFLTKKYWKDVVQLDGFVDQGGVFFESVRNIFLWGSGFGIRLNAPAGWSFSIDVGFPLNHSELTRGIFTYIKLTGRAF